jgi:hypothetical protein
MFKMGSHYPFGHLKHKLWPKEKLGVKLAIWLPTIKSRESTQFPCAQATCNIPLKSSRLRLQICFKPHCNQSFTRKVMRLQSRENPSCGNFGTPTWESRDKKPFGCGLVERRKVYYKGEGGGFPQVRAMLSLVAPNCMWLILAPKVL